MFNNNVTYAEIYYFIFYVPTDTDGECIPVRMSITTYPPDSGASVLVAEVSDVTKGIKDPSIFDKPPQCHGIPRRQSDLSDH